MKQPVSFYAVILATCAVLPSCVGIPYPNAFEAKTVSLPQLDAHVRTDGTVGGWKYAGTDTNYHYVVNLRVMAGLTKRIKYASYKVSKKQFPISHEMPLTTDVERWQGFTPNERQLLDPDHVAIVDKYGP